MQPVFSTTLCVLKLLVLHAIGLTVQPRKTLQCAAPMTTRAAAVSTAITAPRQVIACLRRTFFTIGRHAQTNRGSLAAVLRDVWMVRIVGSCTMTYAV